MLSRQLFDPAVTSHADADRLLRTEPQVQLTNPPVLNNHSNDVKSHCTFPFFAFGGKASPPLLTGPVVAQSYFTLRRRTDVPILTLIEKPLRCEYCRLAGLQAVMAAWVIPSRELCVWSRVVRRKDLLLPCHLMTVESFRILMSLFVCSITAYRSHCPSGETTTLGVPSDND